jgi:hypothetical protein
LSSGDTELAAGEAGAAIELVGAVFAISRIEAAPLGRSGPRGEVPMPVPRQSVIASIGRRWIRAFCATCEEPTVFEVRSDWSSLCAQCASEELRLAPNGLLRLTA